MDKDKAELILKLFSKSHFQNMSPNDCVDVVQTITYLHNQTKEQELKIDEKTKIVDAPKPKATRAKPGKSGKKGK